MVAITVYSKDTCPYCWRALALLDQLKQENVTVINLLEHPDRRAEMIDKAGGCTTVPQIFIGGQHVGGCDDLYALYESGKLSALLTA